MNEKNRTRAREQAQKLEALGAFASGIAHDMNNILAAIMGYAELAKVEMSAFGADDSNLREVLKGVDRAGQLVEQILVYSRYDDGVKRPLPLHSVVRGAVRLLRASIPSQIVIREDISESKEGVVGNETHLYQVLLNLCANAAQAMAENGGELTISLNYLHLQPPGDRALPLARYAVLAVRDTGHGMDDATQARIFERFFTTKTDGTGMGLALVKEVVTGHGGSITVDSTVGVGSAFTIYLPSIALNIECEELPDDVVKGGTESILLVDDEMAFIEAETDVLRNLGYRVITAGNGEEAWRLFIDCPKRFDVIITDLTMPRLGGIALSERMRGIRPGIPIILMTGYGGAFSTKLAESVGVGEVLTKPVTTSMLDAAIRRALAETGIDSEERHHAP